VSYVALIVAGVVAIGLKLYEKYNMDCVKEYLTMGRAQKDEVHRLCPNCGEKVTEKSKFCVKCGFSMEVFLCPKCGAKREKGALFCGECGVTLPVLPLTDILDESDSLIDMSCQEIDEEGDVDGNVRCQKCGHSFLIEERICPKCGTDSKIMV